MANLRRSAESWSDWTEADLDAYDIVVVSEDAATFFGQAVLPEPHVQQELLDYQKAEDMVNDNNAELINLLDLVMVPSSEDSAVVDFTTELLKTLGYAKRHRVARTRKNIPLLICGEWRHAKADVCVMDRGDQDDIMLLVQEDRRFGQGESASSDPQAQLIGAAIATFSQNKRRRIEAGLPSRDSKHFIPGIVVAGTTPTFYKIYVNSELEHSIRHGLYPCMRARVSRHRPAVSRPGHRWSEGMEPLDARKEILRCYEAFKAIVGF
ncbi:unnamed protein product [Cyclocybe aegerita]|uniref:Uncharacterized protein n=1 Tax=Cyclocybe aegerita TaxID=1973307 RepID=A0A8S0VTP1_CYCAE|nr:unnamed protein product [Cyclocybe aegerita]